MPGHMVAHGDFDPVVDSPKRSIRTLLPHGEYFNAANSSLLGGPVAECDGAICPSGNPAATSIWQCGNVAWLHFGCNERAPSRVHEDHEGFDRLRIAARLDGVTSSRSWVRSGMEARSDEPCAFQSLDWLHGAEIGRSLDDGRIAAENARQFSGTRFFRYPDRSVHRRSTASSSNDASIRQRRWRRGFNGASEDSCRKMMIPRLPAASTRVCHWGS